VIVFNALAQLTFGPKRGERVEQADLGSGRRRPLMKETNVETEISENYHSPKPALDAFTRLLDLVPPPVFWQ
jgi:hypothetical protein